MREGMTGNKIVRCVLFVEKWGFIVGNPCKRNQPTDTHGCVATLISWFAVAVVIVLSLVYYISLNSSASWGEFFIGIVQDAGVSFIGLAVLLLSPLTTLLGISTAFGKSKERHSPESKIAPSQIIGFEEYRKLETGDMEADGSEICNPNDPACQDFSDNEIPANDAALHAHFGILLFVTIVSQIFVMRANPCPKHHWTLNNFHQLVVDFRITQTIFVAHHFSPGGHRSSCWAVLLKQFCMGTDSLCCL